MFIDELHITLHAGNGGNGVVRWRHEKSREFSGPSGGNGGKGGDVYLKAVRDIGILNRYKGKKLFEAGRGGDGEANSCHGSNGQDLYFEIPVGSVVSNKRTGEKYELLQDGQTAMVLAGGRGGLGNEYFKSAVNRSPEEATDGIIGERADFFIELQLIVDAGFIGLPNAGKSSLLNALTNAKAKIGSYAFTTLEPNLGDLYGYILADIPGLIEGASEGKGLGHKFLRHIKRTKMLCHCLSLEHLELIDSAKLTQAAVLKALRSPYETIRNELDAYDPGLAEKKEILILTKTDLIDEKNLEVIKKAGAKLNPQIFAVSIIDEASIKDFSKALLTILKKS